MLDPLQFEDAQMTKDYSSGHSQANGEQVKGVQADSSGHFQGDEEQGHEASFSELDRTIAVPWSAEEVRIWLQQSVPLPSDRMEECLHIFKNEGIDGLRLLTLKRNHLACLWMTDSEWLLLNAARERLVASDDMVDPALESHPCSPPKTVPSLHQPSRLQPSSSMPVTSTQESRFLSSSVRLLSLPKLSWSFSTAKDEQNESLATEVQALQGEVVNAEERESILKAQMDHLDEVLRTSQLASYLYTRMRWAPLPGEVPPDDTDVDDWLQRFLVLKGPTIFFYPRAADLSPQGAILLSEIVDSGPIPGHVHYPQDSTDWFAFHITTCHGLRLECVTPLKLQMELWLTSIGGDHEMEDDSRLSE